MATYIQHNVSLMSDGMVLLLLLFLLLVTIQYYYNDITGHHIDIVCVFEEQN